MNKSIEMSYSDRRVKKRTIGRESGDKIFAVLLLVPAFFILGIVIFAPVIKGIWMSFFDYTLATMHNPKWNNFANYITLIKSGEIFLYFKNTLIYVFFNVGTQFVVAMGVALLLNANIKGKNVLRGLFLMPWTIPSVVVALLWSWLLQPQYGVLNYIFYHLGLMSELNTQWVQNPKLSMIAVIVAALWKQTPYMIVMILAGLQSISKEYMEAAEIDGANKLLIFRHVMIPAIRPIIDTTILIAIMNNFQMFTIIYNMTGGGPMDKTMTLSIGAYTKAFSEFDLGAGSAIGVLWLLVLLGFTTIYNKYTAKNHNDYM